MKPTLNLPSFMSVIVCLSLSLEHCPPPCRCDRGGRVSCVGAEVMPVFGSTTQEVWLVKTNISSVPQNAFANLLNISHIYITDDDNLRFLEKHSFYNLSTLKHIQLHGIKTLSYIDQEAFKELPNLKYLGIMNTAVTSFPKLEYIKSRQLDFVLEIVDNAFIKALPANSFTGISVNALTIVASYHMARFIAVFSMFNGASFVLEGVEAHSTNSLFFPVWFDGVNLTTYPGFPLSHAQGQLESHPVTLILNNNGLREIQGYAFNGSRLEEVYLHRNVDLERIDEFAFDGVIHGPTHLDLSDTQVHSLPSVGMENIEKLQVKRTLTLKALPPFSAFLHLQTAHLTFPSHCCGLKMLKRLRRHTEAVFCNLSRAALGKQLESPAVFSQKYLEHQVALHVEENLDVPTPHSAGYNMSCPAKQSQDKDLFVVSLSSDQVRDDSDLALCDDPHTDNGPICTPLPDALNPCDDVISQGFLRVLVWVVSLLAISANSLVLLTLLTCQQKMSVTRFLMGHLAFADSCMGMYLLLIALVDFYTHSQYYQYAIYWQTGSGCNLAGILSVFASELSVYTLTLISFQRWHAIFNAMRPDRHMRLRHITVLMLVGWLLCVIIALLPVLGVNTYQRVSICLPMDTETTVAQAYIISVLSINVIAFIVVCLCYLHIYYMVHNPQHDSSRFDTSMAKRMAVLIFTNFLCLVPICFYGLSAAFHQPLMTITDSKVLLVLFYPLNSCAHPFFYAILTKAFHRDILMLLSRIGLCQKH